MGELHMPMNSAGHRDGVNGQFERRWRARFERFALTGADDAAIAGWSRNGLDARVRNFRRAWSGDRPGALWLDVGCGAGTYARLLAERGLHVVGMDYSLPTLARARDRSASVHAWCVADVTALPVGANAFDGVLCFGVSQALADSAPAVEALFAAVRPGGQVWIDALNAWCLPNTMRRLAAWILGRPARLRYESPRRLKSLVAGNGGVDVSLYWVPILPQRWLRFQAAFEHPLALRLMHAMPWLGALLSHAFVICARRAPNREARP